MIRLFERVALFIQTGLACKVSILNDMNDGRQSYFCKEQSTVLKNNTFILNLATAFNLIDIDDLEIFFVFGI